MFGIFFALVPMLELEIAVYINSHDFDPGAGEWCRWKGPSAILRCVAMHYEIVRRQSTRKQALQLLLLTDWATFAPKTIDQRSFNMLWYALTIYINL